MRYINSVAGILILYLVCVLIGQAVALGIALSLDSYSKTVALAVFIPLYYVMYWVAWRIALFVGERAIAPAGGGSHAKTAS